MPANRRISDFAPVSSLNDAYEFLLDTDNGTFKCTLLNILDHPHIHTHTTAHITDLTTSSQNIIAPWSFTTPAFNQVALGSVSGNVSLNLSLGCFFSLTMTNTTTLSLTGTLTGSSVKNLCLVLTNSGSKTINWPASFRWPNGSIPVLTDIGTDILTFMTLDNGQNWHNFGLVLNLL